MTKDEARTLIKDHDAYVRVISRKTKTDLAALYRRELARRGRELLYGGPGSKDEFISAIVDLEYPLGLMNEARQVYYTVTVF
jgi:hypothetical protein